MRSMEELQKNYKACPLMLRVSLVVLLLWLSITSRASLPAAETVLVGVILDLNSTLGSMINNSLTMAVEDYHCENNNTATRIKLLVQNVPQNDVLAAAEAASDLIEKDNVSAILGPQNSEQAWYIVKLGEKFQIPVIWFPITGPSLLPPPYPDPYQGLNCSHQFRAIADIIKALGWDSIVPIYEETEYGSHLIPCLSNVLKDMSIRMVNVTSIDSDSTDFGINITLDKLNSMRTHAFLVHMSMDLGKRFIRYAEDKRMMEEGYAWILTQELSSLTDPQVSPRRPLKKYMQGALGVRPLDLPSNKTRLRIKKELNFKVRFINSSLTIYGWWAYHTAKALAMAVVNEPNTTKLRNEIGNINIRGKSGLNFNMTNGQLDQSEHDVYNVIGPRERIIGYWSSKTGLATEYNKSGKSYSKYKLMDPLWPGDTLDKPPMMRIGVATRNSFNEFVTVYNFSTPTKIGGFAYNVFLKAVDVLPFPLNNYQFVALMPNKSGSKTPIYEDILCNQMKDMDLDAIIGDITIVAKRTECVDFTLPYLDSRIAMVVSVKNPSTSTKILLKPFDWSLWLILGVVFVAATIIIIILEKLIPNDSNPPNKTKERNPTSETNEGRPSNESDETDKFRYIPVLVYKIDVLENFKSRAAGWMVILTSFLFILVLQVYTANLTSILTQGQIKEPLFNDVDDIKSRNLRVGYQEGSWVKDLLTEQKIFNTSKLTALRSREEYNEALSNGTVAAIFDETPYLALFLSKYKSRFMITGPDYKTGGFAFAFPKKSSLVSHFSNAILKVTQDVESFRVLMAKSSLPTCVEDLEFKDESARETPSLSITNFGGLYPVLLFVVALFLCLSTPAVIKTLRKKLVDFKLEAS